MSAARTSGRTTAVIAAASVAATLLLGLGGAAVAERPAGALDLCRNSMDGPPRWPGTLSNGSTDCSDDYASCLLGLPAREPQILEFDWRHEDKACCYPTREPQILEFDWRYAEDACTPVP